MAVVIEGRTFLTGDGTWPYNVLVSGEDLKLGDASVPGGAPIWATYFGGNDDPEDNGLTASGVQTRNNPSLRGCALAMRVDGESALRGSPIPHMPFGLRADGLVRPGGAFVLVHSLRTGETIRVPIIDEGPAKGAGDDPRKPHGCDLTGQSWRDLGCIPGGDPEPVVVTILGGAKYIGY